MNTALFNLLMFAALVLVISIAFWPRRGLIHRLRREERLGRRVVVEDALKHIFHSERRGQTCTLDSIAGAIAIGMDAVVGVVERMQAAGLVSLRDGRILLTDEGTRYALQIVRAHRLWERYLADETGVHPERWHTEAERVEHNLSVEQIEALATRLGDPRFDPHGDLIPTSDLQLPRRELDTLADVPAERTVRVIHVEDEPDVVYRELLARGIHPGTDVNVVSVSESGILCSANGRSFTLSQLSARNVSIRPARSDAQGDETQPVRADATMRELRDGELADVVHISPACRGIERRRLMDMGIVPGTEVAFDRQGLTGGLRAYRVRGTVVALRDEQAGLIAVKRRNGAFG